MSETNPTAWLGTRKEGQDCLSFFGQAPNIGSNDHQRRAFEGGPTQGNAGPFCDMLHRSPHSSSDLHRHNGGRHWGDVNGELGASRQKKTVGHNLEPTSADRMRWTRPNPHHAHWHSWQREPHPRGTPAWLHSALRTSVSTTHKTRPHRHECAEGGIEDEGGEAARPGNARINPNESIWWGTRRRHSWQGTTLWTEECFHASNWSDAPFQTPLRAAIHSAVFLVQILKGRVAEGGYRSPMLPKTALLLSKTCRGALQHLVEPTAVHQACSRFGQCWQGHALWRSRHPTTRRRVPMSRTDLIPTLNKKLVRCEAQWRRSVQATSDTTGI